ncbi:hypothetical protein GGI19_004824 [Coemansia pectinata]|uniref:Phenazine biosynthesis PhzC/PhzF protein n=1 Tax=Coemansia pectinata TaxID=1052879 RepID=A0A9W8GXK9_9FUNG|nr:hypothetical protein GGI19_004824 [Coemansia pectinata]KAJ2870989.1 hypothetical protein GGH93_005151 [Coemansia aciculifera]
MAPSALRLFIVDAFTNKAFGGNAAGVVIVPHWRDIDNSTMQSISSELNLPMTAFVRPTTKELGKTYTLLWFNAVEKVAFCGHATLAAGHVLFNILDLAVDTIEFDSPAGLVQACRGGGGDITLCFSSNPPEQVQPTESHYVLLHALVSEQLAASRKITFYYSRTVNDLLFLIENMEEQELASLEFNNSPEAIAASNELGIRGVIYVTPGVSHGGNDSITRVFNTGSFVKEDQVTGSAHTMIAPLFNTLFGKSTLQARQCSPRGGDMKVDLHGNSVLITGSAVTIVEGSLLS